MTPGSIRSWRVREDVVSTSECPSLLELDRLRCEVEAVREALEAVEAERRAAA